MGKGKQKTTNKKAEIISINPENPQQRLINRVGEVLDRGGLIAYPTDTFYGIGCDLYNKKGIQQIYWLKNRPLKKPFSFICDSLKEISRYAVVSNYAYKTGYQVPLLKPLTGRKIDSFPHFMKQQPPV